MADLTSLMQIAPTTAASFMGANQAQEEQSQQLKMQQLQQIMQQAAAEEQRKQQMQPYELAAAGLRNDTTRAQLPGVTATSAKLGTDAQSAAATMQSGIDKTNYANKSSVQRSALSDLGNYGDSVKSHMDLQNLLDKMGITGDSQQMIMEKFARVPAAQLPTEMKKLSDAIQRTNPEYAKTMDETTAKEAGALQRARILAESRTDVAEIRGAGKGGGKADPNSDLAAWVAQNAKGSPANQLALYNRAITMAQQQGNQELAQKLYEQAAPLQAQVNADPARSARAGTPDLPAMTNSRVPVNPTPQAPLVSPGGGTPAPQGVGGASNAQAASMQLRQALAKAGQTYEPNKYDYRIGPNGQVQRAPK